MALDLTLTPLYRINGQEIASLPGLVALTPPPSAARGREKDRLIVYLLLTGTSTFSSTEYLKIAQDAADVFYKTSGALTSALRTSAELVNKTLFERNSNSNVKGQYAIGWLTMAAVRETQCTLALSGPMHAWLGQSELRHIHEPAVSGKGLGFNQTINIHYSQTTLNAGDRLLFFGRAPSAWDSTLEDAALSSSSAEALHRRLLSLTGADLNAVFIQALEGTGAVDILKGLSSSRENKKEEGAPASPHAEQQISSTPQVIQPSAYAIPPQPEEVRPQKQTDPLAKLPRNPKASDYPASLPRAQAGSQPVESAPAADEPPPAAEKSTPPVRKRRTRVVLEPPPQTRQAAKALAGGIQFMRRLNTSIGEKFRNFMPRLLPESDSTVPLGVPSTATMMFIAILIPLMVVTIASVVYLRYGRSQQYDTFLRMAQDFKSQALVLTDDVEKRKAWENVFTNVVTAQKYRETSEILTLRQEAETNLDQLLGVTRLQFNPAFSNNLAIEISRMTASESDIYMLNAANGEVLRAAPAPNKGGYELDTKFDCKPGVYNNFTVGQLVDILVLPGMNMQNAAILGIDASGNLLYCGPDQSPVAASLPAPESQWGHVTAFVMDGGLLYVLDSSKSAVWIYGDDNGIYNKPPQFFFGAQTPAKQDVIDIVVSGDDLYMLHSDGHLSTCTFSRLESASTRCEDPLPYLNPFKAYGDTNLFASTHFTQMIFTALPGQSILLLDADSASQGVFRFTPRTLDLLNQYRPKTGVTGSIPPGPYDAIAVGANHVLYLAVTGQVYFATDMP